MRHRRGNRKLGRTTSHRLRLFQHLSEALFKNFWITTTLTKAKEVRPIAERLITLGKAGTPQSQRLAQKIIKDKVAYLTLFQKIGPHFAERPGGYTRIIRIGRRPGDGAESVVLELVEREKLGQAPGRPIAAKKGEKEKEKAVAGKK